MKKLIYIAVFIGLLLVANASFNKLGFFDGKSKQYSNLKREVYVPPRTIRVDLIINYAEDNVKKYDSKADEGDSVFNLLRTVATKESIDLEVKEYDFGVLVESIGGVKNTENKAWIYFVNNQPGDVGADQKKLNDEDTIEWKYIKPSY